MSDNYKYFPRLLGEIISSIRSEYDTDNGILPYYEFGTYLELTRQMDIKNRIDSGKYPLVWLVWEANENQQQWRNPCEYSLSPRIFICNYTEANLSSSDRYTNNFEAILFPIFELMMKYFNCKREILVGTHAKYTKSDHLYWGESLGYTKDANVLFDTLDAIEIKFDELIIKKH